MINHLSTGFNDMQRQIGITDNNDNQWYGIIGTKSRKTNDKILVCIHPANATARC